MKKVSIFLLGLCLGLSILIAQDNVDIYGYYEPQFMGTNVKNNFLQLFSNKLRVDLKWGPLDNITFAANFDFITYHGKKTWNILDFLPAGVTSIVSDDLKSVYVLPFSDRIFLDNAYLKLAFKSFDLTVGKQQISLGTGYVWNPTDVFNIKDPIDPTYEQPGHNAVRVDVPVGTTSTLTLLYSPEEEWKSSAKMIEIKGRLLRFDFALTAIEKTWRFHDYTLFDFENMNFLELPEKRRLLGLSTAGEIFGVGVWSEFAYNWMDVSKDFYELVVGGDYTFNFQTYIMAEYYRNTLGKKNHRDYDLNDWMRLMASEQKAIGQDQVYALVQHPVTDFISLSMSTVYNIADKSFVLVPTFFFNLMDNLDIFAYVNINFGKEGTNFAKDLGSGGMLRARFYF